jgi:glucose-6-phosphate 1-dehydrogenase
VGLHAPPDQDVVVFGATGDLAARKLIPALYNLAAEDLLPKQGGIIGAAPMAWSRDKFVDHARDAIKEFSRTPLDTNVFGAMAKRISFVDISDGLAPLKQACTAARRLAYLAVPSSAFSGLIAEIGESGLADGTSIIIEKPFGHDTESARALNQALHAVVAEQQIYRIDHYLGKETVQNLLVFRFGNSLFERIWNRDAVSRIEITVAESLGVEHRGAFYEETGAIRDIVQNHMFQLLSVLAMEPPVSFEPEALRNEKVKLLNAVRELKPHDAVRGQYGGGVIDGEKVCAYREEPGVGGGSVTETFAAMRLHIDSWRWSGVPFMLRTGKRLPIRDTRMVVVFRDVPLHLFKGAGIHHVDTDQLIVRIQPDEGISLSFAAKVPGAELRVEPVDMDFSYSSSFKTSPPEAYERLLHDALLGDHTLFIREDEVERGWEIVQPLLDSPEPPAFYDAGSWGPEEEDRIAHPRHWHNPS